MAGFGVVEIALVVALQVEIKGVEKGGDIIVGTEGFIEVGFAVAIEIMEAGDTIFAGHVDEVVDDLEAERFIQAGGETFPLEVLEGIIDAGYDPDVSAMGAHHHATIGEECEVGGAEPGVVGIFCVVWGKREGVEGVGFGVIAERTDGGQGIRPASLGRFCEEFRGFGDGVVSGSDFH